MLNLALATAYICERRLSGRPAAARAKCSQSQSACEREQSGHYEKKHNTAKQTQSSAFSQSPGAHRKRGCARPVRLSGTLVTLDLSWI